MKFLFVIAAIILTATASSTEDLWTNFKKEHGKTYKSLREDKLRFEIFKSNLDIIEEHNSKYENGEETWYMGINQFCDLTREEFKAQYLSTKPIETKSLDVMTFNITAPDSIDWREKGVVLSVKDQKTCGSCWAFSAVAAIEGQNAIKYGIKTDLSPQELVDCSRSYKNRGCDGGWMDWAFDYIQDHGISTQADYPYIAFDGKCKPVSNSANITLIGFIDVEHNEEQLKEAVAAVGPVSVAIESDFISFYKGGIYNNFFCGYNIDHAVLVVGYGTEDNHDYWIVKNSWGAGWGDHGYIKMTRNRFNQCGIASKPSYPVLA